MKICPSCKEAKPESGYNRKRTTRDGLQSWCRECAQASTRRWVLANPQRAAAGQKAWRQSEHGRSRKRTYSLRDLEKHPERHAARLAANGAVRRGKMLREPCEVCGHSKAEIHHPDYSRPLEVVWLCKKHHELTHHQPETKYVHV